MVFFKIWEQAAMEVEMLIMISLRANFGDEREEYQPKLGPCELCMRCRWWCESNIGPRMQNAMH